MVVPKADDRRCYTTARARSKSMGDADTRNSKNWKPGQPGWQRHVDGAMVEMAMSIWSGLPFDDTTIGRGDHGIDFAGGIETKYGGRAGHRKLCPRLLIGFEEFRRKVAASEKAGDPLTWLVLGYVHDHTDLGHREQKHDGFVATLIGVAHVETFIAHRYRWQGKVLCWAYDGEDLSAMSLVAHLCPRQRKEDPDAHLPHQRSLL